MNTKNTSRILDAVAADFIPSEIDLLPQIRVLFERKTFMQSLSARPALVILLVLIAVGLLTGVAYAVGRSLGYIPGIGLVEQGAPIRVLAEPVSQTRDGITLTVTEAFLTSDKTVVLFSLENVPWSALSHDENVGGCYDLPWIRLANGRSLVFQDGGGQGNQSRFVYSAVPFDVNEATFLLPCILNTLPGLAPENWKLPLQFIPASPDMTVVPVIEILPTSSPELSETFAPVQLTKALQVGDDFVLVGKKADQDPSEGWLELTGFQLADSSGAQVYAQTPKMEGISDFDWGFQFKADTVIFPVTLSFNWVRISPVPGSRAEFEFDAGNAPQLGQEWSPNQVINIGGRTVTLTNIRLNSQTEYSFEFTSDPDVTGLSLDVLGHIPVGRGGGGVYGLRKFSVGVAFSELPKGKLRVVLSNLTVASPPQTWTMQWSPEDPPDVTSLYGITLRLDKFIPLADGYYLLGHIEWSDDRIKSVFPSGWMMAKDARGQEIPLEPANWQDAGLSPEPDQWLYHIYGKAFNAPITLSASQMGVVYKEPVYLTLDLRSFGFKFSDDSLGTPYKTGLIPMNVPGMMAEAIKATYIKGGDMRGFEIGIEADPALQSLTFGIERGLNTAGMQQVGSGGASFRDETTGLLLSRIITDAPITFPLVLRSEGATISGKWAITWNPPTGNGNATPVSTPQACVTLDAWKRAAASQTPLPSELSGEFLLSRGALSIDPSLFLSNLNGSAEQALVFGNGSLSPDGTKLVYSNENNRLFILDIASGVKSSMSRGMMEINPFWSPDGTKIAFNRQTDTGMNIFVMDANGQNPRALTDTTTNPTLAGWMPDGGHLLMTNALQIQSVDISNGTVKNLLETGYETYGNVSISPDGLWLAFVDRVTGKMAPGIFISLLDGSEKQLLVQLDHWMAVTPVFSPSNLAGKAGKWLAFSVINTDIPDSPSTPTLVNLETCQVLPLTWFNGEVRAWMEP